MRVEDRTNWLFVSIGLSFYILSVLKKANGKVWGAGGAAELLDLPPTTLASKMKKLGIKRTFSE